MPDDVTPVVLGATRRGPDAFCRWCGTPERGCDQASCRRELDPPRFCPTCGRGLKVQVSPTGYLARCREHGPLPG